MNQGRNNNKVQDEILDPPLFEIDFDKVTNLRDVIEIIKGLNIRIHGFEGFESLHEQGYLKEV